MNWPGLHALWRATWESAFRAVVKESKEELLHKCYTS